MSWSIRRMLSGAPVSDTAAAEGKGAPRRPVRAVRARFDGSAAQLFLRRLGAFDFVNSIVLFGASLLLSVLPFVILISSLANHRIDADLSRHIGLNYQGARIVNRLFRTTTTHSAAPIVTALIVLGAVAGTTGDLRKGRLRGNRHRTIRPEAR